MRMITPEEYEIWFHFVFETIIGHQVAAEDYAREANNGKVIGLVAMGLQQTLHPLGPGGERKCWRGLLFDQPMFNPGDILPPYAGALTFSYSEDQDVACFFADPDGLGMRNPDGSRIVRDYGYVVEANVRESWVIFHHSYVQHLQQFKRHLHPSSYDTLLEQKEVLVMNGPALKQVVLGRFPVGCDRDDYRAKKARWKSVWR